MDCGACEREGQAECIRSRPAASGGSRRMASCQDVGVGALLALEQTWAHASRQRMLLGNGSTLWRRRHNALSPMNNGFNTVPALGTRSAKHGRDQDFLLRNVFLGKVVMPAHTKPASHTHPAAPVTAIHAPHLVASTRSSHNDMHTAQVHLISPLASHLPPV